MDVFQDELTGFLECFAFLKSQYKNLSGTICLASMFWSIWVARNELVFRNSRISAKGLELAIKYRAFSWARAARLISPDLQSCWAQSPSRSIQILARKDFDVWLENWSSIYHYMGFIDGSFHRDSSGQLRAGVGGYIINQQRLCQLVFSGPVVV